MFDYNKMVASMVNAKRQNVSSVCVEVVKYRRSVS